MIFLDVINRTDRYFDSFLVVFGVFFGRFIWVVLGF